MSMRAVSFEVSEEYLKTIDEIASNMEVDRASVLNDAVAMYLADYQQELADGAEADRQVEAGETLSHEEVVARYETWKASVRVRDAA
jgi:predicted transcriptional regulator